MGKTKHASLFIIFLTVFIDLLGFGIVLPLLPRYGDHFEASGAALGLLMASFSAMQFLFAPVWGRISDRWGRRPVLLIGLGSSTLFYALFGVATSLGKEGVMLGIGALPWLFITRIGAGIAGATIPTAQAYIADITGAEDRGKGMALIGAAFGVGFTFGPLIGAAFVSADVGGPPSPMPGYVAAVLSGIALLLAVVRLPESLHEESVPSSAHWLSLRDLSRALSRASIGTILVVIFLIAFAFTQLEVTLPLLTKHLQMGPRSNFYVFAYVGFVMALGQGLFVRRLLPRIGENKMSLYGAVLLAGGLAGMVFVAREQSRGVLYAVLPISVLGYAALTPSLQSLLSLKTAQSDQGEILGLGQSMSALARILGSYLGIVLMEGTGHDTKGAIAGGITHPYWAGTIIVGVSAVLILRLLAFPDSRTIQEKAEPDNADSAEDSEQSDSPS